MTQEIGRFSRIIWLLFAIDITLSVVYAVNWWAGEPYFFITQFVSLDFERTIPAWYSSVKYAVLSLALFALWLVPGANQRRAQAMFLLALLVMLMSMDEAVSGHERVGILFIKLMTEYVDPNTQDLRSGYWPFIVGLPAIAVFAVILRQLYHHTADVRAAQLKFVAGMVILMVGAVGMELALNILPPNAADFYEPLVEETLEMLGVTMMLWGALNALDDRGVRLAPRLDPNPR